MPHLLTALVLAALLGYLTLCFLVRWQEEALLFFPEPYLPSEAWLLPERLPELVEEVDRTTETGDRVHGWAFTNPATDLWLLYFHGNAGNLAGRAEWCLALRELPANVLIIDYPGYGRSTGRLDEAGVYRHAEAAWRHLVEDRGVPPGRVVLYGKSLGGGPAAELAVRHPAGGLILQSTFTSVPDMGRRLFPFLPVERLTRNRFDNRDKVARCRLPKLFLHSRADEVVPHEMGEELFRVAADPKQWRGFEGSGHDQLVMNQRGAVLDLFRRFLEGLPTP